jgi:hypothetical protein
VRVDPTAAIAPSRIEAGLASAMPASEALPFMVRADFSWLRQLRFRWEAVGNAWNQWVLGYDPQRQREVLSRLGMREPDWKAMTAAMATLCGLLLLALTAWALRKRIRLDPTQRAWNRLSRKLATHRPGAPPLGRAGGLRPARGAGPPRTGAVPIQAIAGSTSICAMAN